MRSFGSQTVDHKAQTRVYKPGTIKEMKSDDELKGYIAQKDKYVVVSFYKDHCEGCNKVIPRFQERAAKVTKDFDICKVHLLDHEDIAERFQVEFAPHAFLFFNGKIVKEFKGVASDADLDDFFEPLLK